MISENESFLIEEKELMELAGLSTRALRALDLPFVQVATNRFYFTGDLVKKIRSIIEENPDYKPVLSTPSYNRPG